MAKTQETIKGGRRNKMEVIIGWGIGVSVLIAWILVGRSIAKENIPDKEWHNKISLIKRILIIIFSPFYWFGGWK